MNETFLQYFTGMISLKCVSRLLNYSSRNVYDNNTEIDGNNDYFLALLLMPYYILKENLKYAIIRRFTFLWELKVAVKLML